MVVLPSLQASYGLTKPPCGLAHSPERGFERGLEFGPGLESVMPDPLQIPLNLGELEDGITQIMVVTHMA
jgi:hypothetical protein